MLPAARMTKDGDTIFYSIGFDLGRRDDTAVRRAARAMSRRRP
jgi:hypothetical protein